MTILDISFDLETWGRKPGADIRSIGAVVFNQETGFIGKPCGSCEKVYPEPCTDCQNTGADNRGEFYVACDNPLIVKTRTAYSQPGAMHLAADPYQERYRDFQYPLTREPETIAWWADQSADAQAAFDHPIDLKIALNMFISFLCNLPEHAPEGEYITDIRLWCNDPHFDVAILDAAYAACGIKEPWGFRTPRSFRTRIEDAGMSRDDVKKFQVGVEHHALDDAKSQARAIAEAYRRIQNWRELAERYESVSK